MKYSGVIVVWIVIGFAALVQFGAHQKFLDSVKVWEGQCVPGKAEYDSDGLRLNLDCGEHKARTSSKALIASAFNGGRAYECNLFQSGEVDCKLE